MGPEQPPHSRVFVPTPAIFNLPFDNLFINARDGTELHMFLVRQPGNAAQRAPTLLYFHGNAGNIGHRLQNVKGLYSALGCNVALLEYRGYGRSEGSPSEEGLCMDAQAALDYLHTREDIASDRIIIFGRSLGGAVAVDLATRSQNKEKIAAVLLENTFTSIPDEDEDFDEVLDGDNMGDSRVGDAGLSDSLIPQVGDSFCERSQIIDSEKLDSQELIEEERPEENQS